MLRYLETFYRDRLLFLAPLVLALIATIGITMSQPRMYQASAKLWFDGSVSPVDYLNASTPYTAPADLEQSILLELLQTRSFAHQVGYSGPLAAYLTKQPDAYSSSVSPTVLLGKLESRPGIVPAGDEMDTLLASTLAARATVTPVGPQVLNVSFDAPDPQVSSGTVQAMVEAFFSQLQTTRLARAQAAVDFYRQQIAAQPKPQPTDEAAKTLIASLRDKLDQAELGLAAVKAPGAGGYHVIDSPLVPAHARSLRKALAISAGAGLALGASISLLLLMILTWSDRTVRTSKDAQAALGRKLVGTIPLIRER